ncbi:hypothetical protein EVAR_3792_1 [Eumeta japonica]|uniref:Uncharacterized protein n=1 Tax=Eumeta variegata TaxID=151549 RepID=A0A4C1SSI4_EUMVA|nr:hypothetical protein EVAR_3792_1 [Eumeta japonica]
MVTAALAHLQSQKSHRRVAGLAAGYLMKVLVRNGGRRGRRRRSGFMERKVFLEKIPVTYGRTDGRTYGYDETIRVPFLLFWLGPLKRRDYSENGNRYIPILAAVFPCDAGSASGGYT